VIASDGTVGHAAAGACAANSNDLERYLRELSFIENESPIASMDLPVPAPASPLPASQ
jgi:hypothetical protein